MPLNVLIIPDKFKGTLATQAAAQAIGRGWRKARPEDLLHLLPMTDGGDGFGHVMSALWDAKLRTAGTVDAAHCRFAAQWWWEPKSKTAIIESARVIGLTTLPPGRFHPFELDTFGLGAVFRKVAEKGARRCFVGVGGSATNDGGFGLARSLGWQFLDRAGKTIERWTDLPTLVHIRAPHCQQRFGKLTFAVDVRNPLLGPRGATRVYGPQKGLRPRDFPLAELGLRRLAQVVKRDLGRDVAGVPGAGAAGGLGFGLIAFLGAQLESGFELFARHAELERRLRSADLVVTGEGAIDNSTLMGKGTGQIARRCLKLGIPCLALAGVVGETVSRKGCFTQVHALTELTTVEKAKAKPEVWLERLAERVGQGWSLVT